MATLQRVVQDYTDLPPSQLRQCIRTGAWQGPTSGLAPGYTQANVVIVPQALAYDFLVFCQRNPKPCPLLEVLDAGNPEPQEFAPGADIRTDVPRYRVYRHGEFVDEPDNITAYWREDLVSFLVGCSFTFEYPLREAGIAIRHQDLGVNVPMFITNRPCKASGIFRGPLVVSMRPVPQQQVVRAVQVTSRFPAVHGAPVHVGDPAALGIADLQRPDFGDAVPVAPGEVPVFWACGVTPQAVVMHAKPELVLTHAPGHMLVTDRRESELAVL